VSEKEQIIAIRNAVLKSADGCTLDATMQGTIMAQGKLIASTGITPDQCRDVADRYYKILCDSFELYCAEFSDSH
jgi:hypothetical protein